MPFFLTRHSEKNTLVYSINVLAQWLDIGVLSESRCHAKAVPASEEKHRREGKKCVHPGAAQNPAWEPSTDTHCTSSVDAHAIRSNSTDKKTKVPMIPKPESRSMPSLEVVKLILLTAAAVEGGGRGVRGVLPERNI